MVSKEEGRTAALEKIAAYLLANGLGDTGLRALAKAAGISDRMLLYYFTNKDDVMSAVLQKVAGDMAVALDAAVSPGPLSAADFFAEAAGALAGDTFAPYMRRWIEITAAAARGEEPYRSIASGILAGFVGWIETRLSADEAPSVRRRKASAILAMIDGLALLDACDAKEVVADGGAAIEALLRDAKY